VLLDVVRQKEAQVDGVKLPLLDQRREFAMFSRL